jgi:hypothetical protein
MIPVPLPPVDQSLLTEVFSSATFALGESSDSDEAFDYAAAATTTSPAFASADPGNLEIISDGLTLDQAIAEASVWLKEHADSDTVAAFGIVGRSAHSRKTRRVKLEDPALDVDTSDAARWSAPDGAVLAALEGSESWDVQDGEILESIIFTRRARYKPVVEVNRTKSAGEFIAVSGDVIITRGHPTAGVARKEAVRLLKERDKDDHELAELDVYKLGGREGGLPLIRIRRTRLSQVITAKVVHAAPKSDRPAKTVGWLFVTRA